MATVITTLAQLQSACQNGGSITGNSAGVGGGAGLNISSGNAVMTGGVSGDVWFKYEE